MYIINADDFGISPENNSAILKAAQFGILKSTSVMVNTPFVDYEIVNELFKIIFRRFGGEGSSFEFHNLMNPML